MPDVRLLMALALLVVTAVCFLGSTARFFRVDRGERALRCVLLASIVAGLAAIMYATIRNGEISWSAFAGGFMLVTAAQALFWSARLAHGANRPSAAFSATPPGTVIVRGPYRAVRHPFYAAYILAFAGGASWTEMAAAWLIPVWLAVLYTMAAKEEERLILASPLGHAYRDYMKRTGAFVPRLGVILSERAP